MLITHYHRKKVAIAQLLGWRRGLALVFTIGCFAVRVHNAAANAFSISSTAYMLLLLPDTDLCICATRAVLHRDATAAATAVAAAATAAIVPHPSMLNMPE
jgi:hypothetical protein